jgi:hypothetical protein
MPKLFRLAEAIEERPKMKRNPRSWVLNSKKIGEIPENRMVNGVNRNPPVKFIILISEKVEKLWRFQRKSEILKPSLD